MASATNSFARNSEFDSFLFAPIGEERNGMALSVLSAIARLDLDPWHEAASLRALSAKAASQRLALLFSSLPNVQPIPPAPATIARLIELLPGTARDEVWPPKKILGGAAGNPWPLVLYFIFAIITMCAEQAAGRRGAQAPTGRDLAPSASVLDPAAAKAKVE